MNKFVAVLPALLIVGLFYASAFVGISAGVEEWTPAGATTALTNMTDTITELLTDIIPVFIILGVFGAVIGYVKKLSGGI